MTRLSGNTQTDIEQRSLAGLFSANSCCYSTANTPASMSKPHLTASERKKKKKKRVNEVEGKNDSEKRNSFKE